MAPNCTFCHSSRTNIRSYPRLCLHSLLPRSQNVRVGWHTLNWLSQHNYDGPLGQSLLRVLSNLRSNQKETLFEFLRPFFGILLLRSLLLGKPSFDRPSNSLRLDQITFETLQCVFDHNHGSVVYHCEGSLWVALLESRGHCQKSYLPNDPQCAHVFCQLYGRRDYKERQKFVAHFTREEICGVFAWRLQSSRLLRIHDLCRCAHYWYVSRVFWLHWLDGS